MKPEEVINMKILYKNVVKFFLPQFIKICIHIDDYIVLQVNNSRADGIK